MQHFHSFEEVALSNAWATIGSFDGVHRGHQAILAPLVQEAHAAGAPAVVVTFHPHPSVVLRNLQNPHYLTHPDERAELLGQLGIDAVLTLTFTRELAALSAEEFMRLMSQHMGLRQLWAGYDFALGRNRQGDLPMLQKIGEQLGYSVRVISEVKLEGVTISSSQIRALLGEGQVDEAAKMLGRLYSLRGPVVHGDGRGRGLGIPTANLDFWQEKIVPARGVYATWVKIGEERVQSVTNVGIRPMFEGEPRVEAHLLDFDADLYGKTLEVEFVEYLRPEMKFESVDKLLEQIQQDVQQAREIFAERG